MGDLRGKSGKQSLPRLHGSIPIFHQPTRHQCGYQMDLQHPSPQPTHPQQQQILGFLFPFKILKR